jgi:hypothetical protein
MQFLCSALIFQWFDSMISNGLTVDLLTILCVSVLCNAAASPFAIWLRKTLLARHEDMLFATVLS